MSTTQNEADFMDYWHRFLKGGEFKKDIFLSKTPFYPIRNYSNPAVIVFLQGLQGSGKTSIAKYLVEHLDNATYIEQDMFDGDTNMCLGALYHLINSANGPRVIIVSRCNINLTHYRRYLEMCHHMPTIVTFFSPAVFNPLYMTVSLAGIFERSINDDKDISELREFKELSIGNSKVHINDVMSFLIGNYKLYERLDRAVMYNNIDNSDKELLEGAIKIYKRSNTEILEFVYKNYNRLLMLRRPIEVMCKPLLDILNQNSVIPNNNILAPPNPAFIGAYIRDKDRDNLIDILKELIDISNLTIHIKYMIQMYLGGTISAKGTRPRQLQRSPYMPGEVIKQEICALVIRKSDKASAFRLETLPGEEPSFHVLCSLPEGGRAGEVKRFIDSNDSKVVEVIPMRYTLDMIGFWKV